MTNGSTTAGLTRADVLRLGREGEPWQFLPVALQVLALTSDDAIRLLAAIAADQWGLATLSRELWAGLAPAIMALPEVERAVPVYLAQATWRNPENGSRRAIQLIGVDTDAGVLDFPGLSSMLEALKRLNGGTIHRPERIKVRPDRDRLAHRVERLKSRQAPS